jgi:hypothetical protein
MNKYVLLLVPALFFSCEKIKKNQPQFEFKNEIGLSLKSFEIVSIDGKINNVVFSKDSIIVFEKRDFNTYIDPTVMELDKYSQTGEGRLKVFIELTDGRKINTGLGNFKNYRISTEFAPRSWQTITIRLIGKETNPEIRSSFRE